MAIGRGLSVLNLCTMVGLVVSLVGCEGEGDTFNPSPTIKSSLESGVAAGANEKFGIIPPIPREHDQDPVMAKLGERLFNDVRLSSDGTVSCASCHRLDEGGADGQIVSLGVGNALGAINSPTVFNSRFNFRQFWDGRAESLEAQAAQPLTNPVEMANSWAGILSVVNADPAYEIAFNELFPDGVTQANILTAIATFERTLITPDSAFDQYIRGNNAALSSDAQRGWKLFQEKGCVACHQGINVGGNMYQHFGIIGNYFEDRGNITTADYGLYNVTGKETDRYRFKVPSLRNVALTAPYFHDGSAATLTDAIQVMAEYQLGTLLSEEDIVALEAFLMSLTGQQPWWNDAAEGASP